MTNTTSELQKKINEMIWFHSIDFGNGVMSTGVKSALQLRREADAFFGSIDLKGRTFLDIGAWNGYFSFEAKRRGAARVLATDKFMWTHPHLKGRESFELARQHLGYSIEAEEIDIPELTVERVGAFEVVLLADVFYQFFEAPKLLKQAAHTATKLFIVETRQDLVDLERPAMVYYPGTTLANDGTHFWGPNPPLMLQLLTESGFKEVQYRPHPDTEHDHTRGIYLAFRDVESMISLSFNRTGPWRDLNRQRHVCEAEGYYCYGDGVSGWLTVLAFEADLRVGGRARFSISLNNDGIRVWPPVRLVLRWTVKEPDGGELILTDQIAAELSLLELGKSQVLETSVPVPVNGVLDVDIAFHLMAADGTHWEPKDLPASLRRHITGQSAEDVPPDFDYEVMYGTVDLQKDWWTPVGPATRAEYESLGRAQCKSLVELGLGPHSTVLDIGCGTGKLAEALAPILSPEGLYYGTDVAEAAVQFCRAKFPQSQFHFVKNERTSIPIYGIDFDFICLSSVFIHMFPADIAVMLVDIRRLMADSGCVVADAFVSPAIAGFVGNRAMIQLNEGNLLAEFRKHGFRVREISSTTWNEQCRRVVYHLTANEPR
jgi:tRNA (mo5U34)-methyltransferase